MTLLPQKSNHHTVNPISLEHLIIPSSYLNTHRGENLLLWDSPYSSSTRRSFLFGSTLCTVFHLPIGSHVGIQCGLIKTFSLQRLLFGSYFRGFNHNKNRFNQTKLNTVKMQSLICITSKWAGSKTVSWYLTVASIIELHIPESGHFKHSSAFKCIWKVMIIYIRAERWHSMRIMISELWRHPQPPIAARISVKMHITWKNLTYIKNVLVTNYILITL